MLSHAERYRRAMNLADNWLPEAPRHLPEAMDDAELAAAGRRVLELQAKARLARAEDRMGDAARHAVHALRVLAAEHARTLRMLRSSPRFEAETDWWARKLVGIRRTLREVTPSPGSVLTGIAATAGGVALTFMA